MRILLVNDYATATAGAERITLDLRDGLRTRGHDVRVLGIVQVVRDVVVDPTGQENKDR